MRFEIINGSTLSDVELVEILQRHLAVLRHCMQNVADRRALNQTCEAIFRDARVGDSEKAVVSAGVLLAELARRGGNVHLNPGSGLS